jgi:excisionase family DNA binding protein
VPLAEEVPVVPVHPTVTNALQISRATAYHAVKTGEIPSLRVGSRVLVPTAWLRRVLQLDPDPAA